MIIIAAEGGGIRAAYWTSAVLTSLQDKYPDFADHVFAISGVSGGSLGAGIFTLLVNEQHKGNSFSKCHKAKENATLLNCSNKILSADFLSPTIATMLYPDLLQRFLPVGFGSFDRARTLENAWEASWRNNIGNDILAEPFNNPWATDTKTRLPSLFFNSTSVETGKRFIFSNLSVNNIVEQCSDFVDVYDAQKIVNQPVPFSTAIHASARFTYISPAGTIRDKDSKEIWGHIVDGGYFEDSGAATAAEILFAVMNVAKDRGIEHKIRPIVIMISNNPSEAPFANPWVDQKPDASKWMNEILSPLRTMLNTREARGRYSQMAIQKEVELPKNGEYIPVYLQKMNIPLPLGWMLSPSSREEMDRQLKVEMRKPDGIGRKIGKYLPARISPGVIP